MLLVLLFVLVCVVAEMALLLVFTVKLSTVNFCFFTAMSLAVCSWCCCMQRRMSVRIAIPINYNKNKNNNNNI